MSRYDKVMRWLGFGGRQTPFSTTNFHRIMLLIPAGVGLWYKMDVTAYIVGYILLSALVMLADVIVERLHRLEDTHLRHAAGVIRHMHEMDDIATMRDKARQQQLVDLLETIKKEKTDAVRR